MLKLFIIMVPLVILFGLTHQSKPNLDTALQDLQHEYDNYQIQIKQENMVVQTLWEQVKQTTKTIAKQEDYPYAVAIGMMALESGSGTSYFARTRNNFCGLNAVDWNPNLANSFETVEAGVRACIGLVKYGKHYATAYANRHDPVLMVQLIKNSGYATDPNYVSKVINMRDFKDNL